jgi:hypothetical protein
MIEELHELLLIMRRVCVQLRCEPRASRINVTLNTEIKLRVPPCKISIHDRNLTSGVYTAPHLFRHALVRGASQLKARLDCGKVSAFSTSKIFILQRVLVYILYFMQPVSDAGVWVTGKSPCLW